MTLSDLLKKFDLEKGDRSLYEQAFIHRSYINENPRTRLHHNERLEFLGDAVLELSVTEFLYKKFPERNEGDLTAYRSALVNAVTIGGVAEELLLNDLMMLSKGEAKDVTKARQSILADAFEAFLGAIYLNEGYDVAKRVVSLTIIVKTDEVIEKGLYKDAKSFVQEKAQELYSVTPSYSLIDQMGPDHDKRFVIAISFGEQQIALGEGKSKQEAETNAAKNALLKKNWVKS